MSAGHVNGLIQKATSTDLATPKSAKSLCISPVHVKSCLLLPSPIYFPSYGFLLGCRNDADGDPASNDGVGSSSLPAEPGFVDPMAHHVTALPILQAAVPLLPLPADPFLVDPTTHYATSLPILQPATPLFPLPGEPGVIHQMTHYHVTGLPILQSPEPLFLYYSPTLDFNFDVISAYASQELDSALAIGFSGNQYTDMGFGLDPNCQ